MNDLMAVLMVRRLLSELGYTSAPEDVQGNVDVLTRWIALPRDDLGGQSPLHVLAQVDGPLKVKEVLKGMLERRGGPPPAINNERRG